MDRDNDKNPVVALREIAEETIDLQRVEQDLIKSLSRAPEPEPADEEVLDLIPTDQNIFGLQDVTAEEEAANLPRRERGDVARGSRGGDRGGARRPPPPVGSHDSGRARTAGVRRPPTRRPTARLPARPRNPPPAAAGRARPASIRQFELTEKVLAYDPQADTGLIDAAYVLAMKAHGAQRRDNGDPYITHPLAVADILAGYRLDTATHRHRACCTT